MLSCALQYSSFIVWACASERDLLQHRHDAMSCAQCGQGYKPPDEPASEYQTIPMSKIEDFGVHCKQYYPLNITYFKSPLDSRLLDLLWAKYWVNTLAASSLLVTRDLAAGQMNDIGTTMIELTSCRALAKAYSHAGVRMASTEFGLRSS